MIEIVTKRGRYQVVKDGEILGDFPLIDQARALLFKELRQDEISKAEALQGSSEDASGNIKSSGSKSPKRKASSRKGSKKPAKKS